MWLTIADCQPEQTEGPLSVAPGFIPTACTGFFGTYSLWMDTFLSLDIVGRALNLAQSNVPFLFEEWIGEWAEWEERR